MYAVLSDGRIYAYLSEPPPITVEDLRRKYEFQSRGRSPDGTEIWLNWVLRLRASGELIGFHQATVRAAHCSIAYVLNPRHWGKGYATEASIAVISHLFREHGIARVRTEINARNEASLRLVRRLGFSLAGHDEDADDEIHEIARTEWSVLHP